MQTSLEEESKMFFVRDAVMCSWTAVGFFFLVFSSETMFWVQSVLINRMIVSSLRFFFLFAKISSFDSSSLVSMGILLKLEAE